MSLASGSYPTDLLNAELESLRKRWFWLLILGTLLIVVGLAAIGSAFIATLATILLFGIFLLIGGGLEILSAFWARRWRGFWMHLLAGILYVVLGVLLVERPLASAAAFTLMLAVAFLVGGLFRIILALSERFHGWVWGL